MITIKNKHECCGCGACSQSCPLDCIKMVEDEEGFLYPVIEEKICIDCGICEKSCPVKNEIYTNVCLEVPDTYAAINRDETVRRESSSGGIFNLLAEHILSKKGVVFGAAMTDDCTKVIHICIDEKEDLALLRGSKYVQSDIEDSYRGVKSELEKGRYVIYSGTPCQIAGLKTYLKSDYDNLYTVEVICHGVPSPSLWKKYISHISRKLGDSITTVNFRYKPSKSHREDLMIFIKAANGKVYKAYEDEDPFYKFFLSDICLRPSCYHCHFKGCNRMADFTIGDFWGINKVIPDFGRDGGVSLLLLHSKKSQMVFNSIMENMEIRETEFKRSIENNSAYMKSVTCPKERNRFFSDLKNISFHKMIKRYGKRTMKSRLRCILEKLHMLSMARKIKHMIKV